MMTNSADNTQRPRYQKPELKHVRLDVKANTLGVSCWNSTLTDEQANDGCNPPSITCAP